MQQRKNSKNNRNYLIKCTCPREGANKFLI
ncbi:MULTISPECIES: hypothetical protein [Klebsiella]